MDPLTLSLIMSGLGTAGGLFFKDNGIREMMKILNEQTSPGRISNDANLLFKMMVQSPAFAKGQSNVYAGANSAASGVAQNLAARGLGTSGIGSIMGGIGSNLAGFKMADLYSTTYENALKAAQQSAMARIQGAGYWQPPRNVGADIYGGALNAIGQYFKAANAGGNVASASRQPQAQIPAYMGGGGNPTPNTGPVTNMFDVLYGRN